MINPQELRIGNHVLIEDEFIWKEFQVEGVCLATPDKQIENFSQPFIGYKLGTTIIRYYDDDTEDDYLVRPIPLTPEILERLGFDKDDVFEKWFIYLNKHDCDTDKLTFRKEEGFICFDGIKYRTLLKHITYLHQLQNLYFALTNEELTLKLKV